MRAPALALCPGCRGLFPDVSGPVHRYMASSPGCWAAYGRVLAREYSDPDLADVHRLSVDAYAAQHPGEPSPQTMNSVGVHLIRLCLTVEHGFDVREANRIMVAISKVKGRFGWLRPPASLGGTTVADVVDAANAETHRRAVRAWARSVWVAWAEHHETVRGWVPELQIR
ncbi:MAG TPA: DUF5946 family protein [Rubricoccaceae bacterium]